jgi:NifB/MoaA-like Fe-S oxidoreductase
MRSLRTSRCPRSDCDGMNFEEKELQVKGDDMRPVRYLAIQCSKCGAVVAVNDWADVPRLLDTVSKKLDDMMHKLGVM